MSGDDDEPSFADLVGPVRRLRHDGVEPVRRRTPAGRRPDPSRDDDVRPDAWHDREDDADADDYQRAGVQRGIVRGLKRGRYPVEDEIDLHGLSVAEARARLARFLAAARGPRVRCVRVIHGKGLSSPGFEPVLKPRVRSWLRQDARVLAYTEAPARDGGSGALYVLLRSRER